MKTTIVWLCGLLLSTAAFAQDRAPSDAPADAGGGVERTGQAEAEAQPVAEAAGERLICRRIVDSDTRLSRSRVCLTREQWRQRSRNN